MLTSDQLEKLTTRFDRMSELPKRAQTGLRENGIEYVAEYLVFDRGYLALHLPGLGAVSKREIKVKLESMGFKLSALADCRDDFDRLHARVDDFKMKHRKLSAEQLREQVAHLKLEGITGILLNPEVRIGREKGGLAGETAHLRWLMDRLPEDLRKGLKVEFTESVFNDPKVQEKVQKILISAVIEKLGLHKD